MGLVQEAVQIWILVGCSSRLTVRVAFDAKSIAAGMCFGLIQMYQSSRYAHSLAPLSSVRWVSERMYRDIGVDRCRKAAGRQWASLVDSAAGLDVCACAG